MPTGTLTLDSGETVEADFVVSGVGMFGDLVYPQIEGLDSFAGTSFHSADWNWDHDLTGETVGVIGSAASAIQFVPEIVKQAGQVHLFQRSANWVLPRKTTPIRRSSAKSSAPIRARARRLGTRSGTPSIREARAPSR